MWKLVFSIFLFSALSCYAQNRTADDTSLIDNDLTTSFTISSKTNKILLKQVYTKPVLSYKIYSTGEIPAYDPISWTLKGSNDGKKWIVIDERKEQSFCSRFQENRYVVSKPGIYKQYMFDILKSKADTLKIAEIILSEETHDKIWEDFRYPMVHFEDLNPETKGSELYRQLVQNPDQYIRYHARKVAEILYFTPNDSLVNVQKINYTLKDYDGVSAKGGSPDNISIVYSTRHVEKSALESLAKLDFETRGVLYHELTHAYQYEPKGVGSYGTNKIFWSFIEGLADAVRAESGFFDFNTRKPGGNWMDGYRTTGFFVQWLTTKDPDAIRKFNKTAADLDVWSWDGAMKLMFGSQATIDNLWEEYQVYLKNK